MKRHLIQQVNPWYSGKRSKIDVFGKTNFLTNISFDLKMATVDQDLVDNINADFIDFNGNTESLVRWALTFVKYTTRISEMITAIQPVEGVHSSTLIAFLIKQYFCAFIALKDEWYFWYHGLKNKKRDSHLKLFSDPDYGEEDRPKALGYRHKCPTYVVHCRCSFEGLTNFFAENMV